MPRRRRVIRRIRRSDAAPLLGLLLIGLIILLLVITRGNLPRIVVPITGLPEVKIPTVQVNLKDIPLTPMPDISLPGLTIDWGNASKTSGCVINNDLPDAACTPGDVIEGVTKEQVCQVSYASEPGAVAPELRDQIFTAYGLQNPAEGQYQIDHLVSLRLGGSNDPSNLWPQPVGAGLGYAEKDRAETYLHEQVCSGAITLAEAQRRIANDWRTVYQEMPK